MFLTELILIQGWCRRNYTTYWVFTLWWTMSGTQPMMCVMSSCLRTKWCPLPFSPTSGGRYRPSWILMKTCKYCVTGLRNKTTTWPNSAFCNLKVFSVSLFKVCERCKWPVLMGRGLHIFASTLQNNSTIVKLQLCNPKWLKVLAETFTFTNGLRPSPFFLNSWT
jgi:hypothetical protein